MKCLLMPLLLALVLALPLSAQTDALREAAERYVQNPVQQQVMDDMLSPEAIVAQIRAMAPQLTEDQLQLVGRITAEEMATIRPNLEAAMVEAAISTFTLEEILALEAFHATPLGASVMGKMQPFMATALGAIAGPMQQAQMRVGQRVTEELTSQ